MERSSRKTAGAPPAGRRPRVLACHSGGRRLGRLRNPRRERSVVEVVIKRLLSLLVALVPLSAALTAAAATPFLQLDTYTAISGSSVTAYGSNFCVAAGCSKVTITLEQTVVATEVAVAGDGSFRQSFTAEAIPRNAPYTVTARQTAADGATVASSAGLRIVPADVHTSTTPTPGGAVSPMATPSPAASRPPQTPGGGGGSSPAASAVGLAPSAEASPPSSGGPASAASAGRGGGRAGVVAAVVAAAVLSAAAGVALVVRSRRRRRLRQ